MTFGYGAIGIVIRSGILKVPSMPKLENLLLVNGLKVNLTIISQPCDQNFFVKFTKYKCSMVDNSNTCIMGEKDRHTTVIF